MILQKKMISIIFFVMIFTYITGLNSFADTINAVSPNRTDVISALSLASYGDVVVVPTGSATWSGGISIQKCITLKGAGIGKTTIKGNVNGSLIHINPDIYSSDNDCGFRITGFTFDGGYIDNSVGVSFGQSHTKGKIPKNIRIYNNEFIKFERAAIQRNDFSWGYALIDNNKFIDCRKVLNAYGAYTYSWQMEPSPIDSLGTVNSIYLEDNEITVTNNVNDSFATISSGHGGRWVARFNVINYNRNIQYIQGHDVHGNNGSSDGSNRGAMVVEAYNNTHNISNADRHIKALDIRGGTIMCFNEKYSNDSSTKTGFIQIREEDGADGICCDSPGPGGWETCCDPVRDTYIFNNRNVYSDTEAKVIELASEAEYVEPDYNYWILNSSFNGSSGVGIGTKAQMEAILNCKQYTGFWVTNEGEWNSLIDGPDGQLYRCGSSNNWELYYKPFTYPHPLRNENYTEKMLSPPANLRVVN